MKKTLLILVIIILIAAISLFLNKKTPNPAVNISQPVQTGNEVANPSVNQPITDQNVGVYQISIKNFSFSPPVLNINVGQKVVWTNNDSAPHQISADDNSFSSAVLNKGGVYEFVFAGPGAYNYHCGLHPSMKGQIIVK